MIQLIENLVGMEAPVLVALDKYCLLVYWIKVEIRGLLILLHIIMIKKYNLQIS